MLSSSVIPAILLRDSIVRIGIPFAISLTPRGVVCVFRVAMQIPKQQLPTREALVCMLLQVNKCVLIHTHRAPFPRFNGSATETDLTWMDSYVAYLLMLVRTGGLMISSVAG